jgi:hypothetical protein
MLVVYAQQYQTHNTTAKCGSQWFDSFTAAALLLLQHQATPGRCSVPILSDVQ